MQPPAAPAPPSAEGAPVRPPGETPPVARPVPETTRAAPALPPVPDDLPDECQALGEAASSPKLEVALASRVELASCLAGQRMKPLSLVDCEQSVRELDAAAAPSLTVLDDVIAAGVARWKLIALHARGTLLASMADRMATTVPEPPDGSPDTAYRLRDLRQEMLQPLLAPWRDQARDAFAEVVRGAGEDARLVEHDPGLRRAVEDSKRMLAGP